ncbi:hypothetical protein OEZ86_004502 [Tetradesmus obliquus]|nr:hypothetical protein OEZ86_004502 [Tetradesmus obliquus]
MGVLRLLYCDSAGVRRCRAVPLSSAQLAAAQAAAPYSTGLTKGSMGQPAAADTVLPGSGLSAVGEVLLLPDLDAAVALPWAQGHSMAPVDMLERDMSKAFACCPRSALKHALAALKKSHSIQLLVGFELEFMLLKPAAAAAAGAAAGSELLLQSAGNCYRPVDESIYCQSTAFDQAALVLDKMVEALQSMGIGVVQYHAESAPGQFEIATKPFPALQAADKLLLTKEAICSVAAQAGLAVTFLPKPLPGYAGSGCHCHISLWEADSSNGSSSGKPVSLMTAAAAPTPAADGTTAAAANPPLRSSGSSTISQHYVPGYPLLSSTAACFLAGLLDYLPALLPFTCPTENSYARLQPGTWAGALTCWGWDNREAPLRLSCPNAANPAASCNIEFKAFDGTANPYIGLAAILAAGMRGIEEAASLPPPLQVEPAAALAAAAAADGASSGAAAAAVSKLQQLPGSLAEALAALQGDSSLQAKLQQLLGPELLRAYLAVKDWEAQQQTGTDKLLLRY